MEIAKINFRKKDSKFSKNSTSYSKNYRNYSSKTAVHGTMINDIVLKLRFPKCLGIVMYLLMNDFMYINLNKNKDDNQKYRWGRFTSRSVDLLVS